MCSLQEVHDIEWHGEVTSVNMLHFWNQGTYLDTI